ncbi:MAG: 4'-phosphopantetheinyl transferase superfamily protein [Nocardia sp.]|nr:4'-phosphopantetheinyl transferase superfamily protein [Nocardia sp.]
MTRSQTPLGDRQLTGRERERLRQLPTGDRRREWLTSRRVLKLAAAGAGLGADTTALTFPHPRISLSHTGTYAAAALALGPVPDSVLGVGIDIERPRPVDPRTARFFLTESEAAHATDPDQHLRLWTVKEAVFKADPGNAERLLFDYRLDDPAAAAGIARLPDRPDIRFHYRSQMLGRTYISVAVAVTATGSAGVSPNRRDFPMSAITFDDVADRIYQLLSIQPGTLTPASKVRELAADSFQLVEMIIDVQEEFDVIIDRDQLAGVETLGDLVDLLREQGAVTADAD